MEKAIKKFGLSVIFTFLLTGSLFSQNEPNCDSLKVLEQYSLFSEYHKNKDYQSAVPYGWNVLACNHEKFAKWVYFKMEETLWYLHDSADISPEEKKAIEDSILGFYDKAVENYPGSKGYFQARKAFVAESWLSLPDEELITLYETASQDTSISTYYFDRLGELYYKKKDENTDYKLKGLDLYEFLSNKEPENSIWIEKQEKFVDNINELADLACKQWELDRENLVKAWKCASTLMRASRFQESITPLEFLTSKEPETINYWNQLATAYQRTDQTKKAEEVYRKLISLEPDNKNHYLNLGIILSDEGQLAAARTQFQKASQLGGNWGLPIYYEGLLYEKAARNCGFDFPDKVVYQLAVDTYRRAKNMDASVAGQAQDRINALSSSVPTQEDYFFRGYKSGATIPVTGECYGWIGKSITVP